MTMENHSVQNNHHKYMFHFMIIRWYVQGTKPPNGESGSPLTFPWLHSFRCPSVPRWHATKSGERPWGVACSTRAWARKRSRSTWRRPNINRERMGTFVDIERAPQMCIYIYIYLYIYICVCICINLKTIKTHSRRCLKNRPLNPMVKPSFSHSSKWFTIHILDKMEVFF